METDADGNRLLITGLWRSDSTPSLTVQGGQGMHFVVTNSNVLPATLSISGDDGEEASRSLLLLEQPIFAFLILAMNRIVGLSPRPLIRTVRYCRGSSFLRGFQEIRLTHK